VTALGSSTILFSVRVTLGVRVLLEAGYFSPHHRVQTSSGVHPASYPMGTRGSFPGDKVAGP
jgi:hypothetical protein